MNGNFGSVGFSRSLGKIPTSVNYEDYDTFREYYCAVADDVFPFPEYNDYQDEILYEVLEAYLEDDYLNVVVEGPTGIGKSAVNVTVAQVLGIVAGLQNALEEHFGITLRHLNDGSAFYTTPQKSLRNQLAEDDDLENAVRMLKARADYYCQVGKTNCSDCRITESSDESCRSQSGCTYWNAKMTATSAHIAVLTFAMLIVDNHLPAADDSGRISFEDRDLVIVDEGHGVEGQSASLFAGFDLSPWSLTPEVYGDAGKKISWDADRMEDVHDVLREIQFRGKRYVENNEGETLDATDGDSDVDRVKNTLRKIDYALETYHEGEGWVVNVDEISEKDGPGMTKKMQIKPVRVDDFLKKFIWSRGRRRLVTSATIPFRNNIGRWAERIGLSEDVKFISKPTPFPREHRLIHTNTMVGSMSSSDEDANWRQAMNTIKEIHSHHKGEKGVIHSVSYSRTEKVVKWLGEDVAMADDPDLDTDALLERWQDSDKDIFVSPTVTEGVDLYEDKCRWQVLLKVPFAYGGDSRVSYLLNEKKEWNWYYECAATDFIQSVGRAVRGSEPEEAASYYVIDEKLKSIISRVSIPDYILEAITGDDPKHWENPSAAPWR